MFLPLLRVTNHIARAPQPGGQGRLLEQMATTPLLTSQPREFVPAARALSRSLSYSILPTSEGRADSLMRGIEAMSNPSINNFTASYDIRTARGLKVYLANRVPICSAMPVLGSEFGTRQQSLFLVRVRETKSDDFAVSIGSTWPLNAALYVSDVCDLEASSRSKYPVTSRY